MQVDAAGKAAVTEFSRLENYSGRSFVEARPLTGRTHQIRVHAAFLGTPCAGDPRYSKASSQEHWRNNGLDRLFLHAHALEFDGISGERMHLSAPLPAGLSRVLERL